MWYTLVSYWLMGIAGFTGALVCVGLWNKAKAVRTSSNKENISPTVSPVFVEDWAALASGSSGWLEIEQAWLRKTQELYSVFCKKQHDYGPTNIAVGGLKGVTVRIGDKTSRLWELSGVAAAAEGKDGTAKGQNAVNDESLRDTLLDLADYGIIGTLVYDQDWPILSPKEVWGSDALRQSTTQESK